MRFNSLAGKLDPYELESVEILKGPSSVLYGEVPPGGLINQVTKRPGSERHTEIEAQFGSYSRRQGAIDTTGSIDANQKYRYPPFSVSFVTLTPRSTTHPITAASSRRPSPSVPATAPT